MRVGRAVWPNPSHSPFPTLAFQRAACFGATAYATLGYVGLRPRFGCALCSLGDLRVHRPARRIHIRLRGRVLRNSPQPPAVCSAAAPNQAAHGTSGTRRALGGVGLAPAPRAVAPCAFAAFRWALSFVGGIPPPRLAPRSTAHSQNRAADVSLSSALRHPARFLGSDAERTSRSFLRATASRVIA